MSLKVRAKIAQDRALIDRVAACAAVCGPAISPLQWADKWMWRLAASDGWVEAYEASEGITDQMIHSAVSELVAELESPPEEPPIES